MPARAIGLLFPDHRSVRAGMLMVKGSHIQPLQAPLLAENIRLQLFF